MQYKALTRTNQYMRASSVNICRMQLAIFIASGGGGGPIGTSTTIWLVVPDSDDARLWVWRNMWND
jgi:hypothetical protein